MSARSDRRQARTGTRTLTLAHSNGQPIWRTTGATKDLSRTRTTIQADDPGSRQSAQLAHRLHTEDDPQALGALIAANPDSSHITPDVLHRACVIGGQAASAAIASPDCPPEDVIAWARHWSPGFHKPILASITLDRLTGAHPEVLAQVLPMAPRVALSWAGPRPMLSDYARHSGSNPDVKHWHECLHALTLMDTERALLCGAWLRRWGWPALFVRDDDPGWDRTLCLLRRMPVPVLASLDIHAVDLTWDLRTQESDIVHAYWPQFPGTPSELQDLAQDVCVIRPEMVQT